MKKRILANNKDNYLRIKTSLENNSNKKTRRKFIKKTKFIYKVTKNTYQVYMKSEFYRFL